MLEFTSNDYCIEENKGGVTVCVTKSRTTEYDFDIEINAFESTPRSAISMHLIIIVFLKYYFFFCFRRFLSVG